MDNQTSPNDDLSLIHIAVKIPDYADQAEALLADPNPFALVTAAHLFTRQTKGDPEQRYAAKWRLAKLLYERKWDKQRIIDLFSVIDWLMRLPTELEKRLMQEVYTCLLYTSRCV